MNLRALYSWRQKRGRIRGHGYDLKPNTAWPINKIVEKPKHIRMDRLPEFQETAERLCLS